MNIVVTRQGCCPQDDALGPLTLNVELTEALTIQDLAKSIGEADFLQFSASHNIINVYSGDRVLLSIPSLDNKVCLVEYFVNKLEQASKYIKLSTVECKWPNDL